MNVMQSDINITSKNLLYLIILHNPYAYIFDYIRLFTTAYKHVFIMKLNM